MDIKILDTNIILDYSIEYIANSMGNKETKLIIPYKVLVELDTFKVGLDLINENCRRSIRYLDNLRSKGNLADGVMCNDNLTIQVLISQKNIESFDPESTDLQIIEAALAFKESEDIVEIITKDLHERLVADVLGVDSRDLETKTDMEIYSGTKEISITDEQATELNRDWKRGCIKVNDDLIPNQFAIMEDSLGNKHYGIYQEGCISRLKNSYEAWGVKPKKFKDEVIIEQAMLMHLLLDPTINMVTAVGDGGCGKTFLALACALEQVLNKFPAQYDKIVLLRPMVSIGKDMGALPGDKFDKLEPWLGSAFDNLEVLFNGYMPNDSKESACRDMHPCMNIRERIKALIDAGKLELEALTFIRGRSIPNQFIIVDDAQNLTQEQATTIVSRIGEGSKLVMLGDVSPKQIDDRRLNQYNNGLTYVIDKLSGKSPIIGHITLNKIVRSPLAELGAKYL